MDPSAVATVGSAAVVAVADLTAEATRTTADGGQDHAVRGLFQMSQTNGNPQSEQGRQSNDGRTSEAPPHQMQQDESHGPF